MLYPRKLTEFRRDGTFPWARPDSKTQVPLFLLPLFLVLFLLLPSSLPLHYLSSPLLQLIFLFPLHLLLLPSAPPLLPPLPYPHHFFFLYLSVHFLLPFPLPTTSSSTFFLLVLLLSLLLLIPASPLTFLLFPFSLSHPVFSSPYANSFPPSHLFHPLPRPSFLPLLFLPLLFLLLLFLV